MKLDGLGDNYRSLAVDADPATLVDQPAGDDRSSREPSDRSADQCVALVGLNPAPSVEGPVNGGQRAVTDISNERWPTVAKPPVVEFCLDELDPIRQPRTRVNDMRWVREQGHGLELSYCVGRLDPRPPRVGILSSDQAARRR